MISMVESTANKLCISLACGYQEYRSITGDLRRHYSLFHATGFQAQLVDIPFMLAHGGSVRWGSCERMRLSDALAAWVLAGVRYLRGVVVIVKLFLLPLISNLQFNGKFKFFEQTKRILRSVTGRLQKRVQWKSTTIASTFGFDFK
jgi:hypothetical protein